MKKSARRKAARAAQRKLNGTRTTPRVIFFHVPKCGGSSLRRFLDDRLDGVALDANRRRADWEDRVEAARTAPLAYGHFDKTLLSDVRGDAYVFTVLRDPMARLVSHYRYHCSLGRAGAPGLRSGETLSEFVMNPAYRNVMTQYLGGTVPFDPATDLPEDEIFARAIETLDTMDAVGFAETLDQGMVEICDAAGIAYLNGPWRENVTPPVPYPVEITPAVRDSVSLDQRLFQYALTHSNAVCAP